MWNVLLLCLFTGCVVATIVCLLITTKIDSSKKDMSDNANVDIKSDFTECSKDTENTLTKDMLIQECKKAFSSVLNTEDVPKVFRKDSSKNWYYLDRWKQFGYTRCDIYGSTYEDLMSLDILDTNVGDIAYTKLEDKFFIHNAEHQWIEYTETNFEDILTELDYKLTLETNDLKQE